jgi:hypothetical protein
MPPRRRAPVRPPTLDAPSVRLWLADSYRWTCAECPCTNNLRGLLREVCVNCRHIHPPPQKEPPHVS